MIYRKWSDIWIEYFQFGIIVELIGGYFILFYFFNYFNEWTFKLLKRLVVSQLCTSQDRQRVHFLKVFSSKGTLEAIVIYLNANK